MTTNFTPAQLVDAASDLLARPGAPVTASYPRAAALLARQALEARVQREWQATEVSLAETNMANQFHALCQLRNAEIAGMAHETWSALSHACHHHPFDLSPTVSELKPLIDTVRTLIAASW